MVDPAATREEELHWRRIDMRAWRRSDELFELEGRVTDRKPYDFERLAEVVTSVRRFDSSPGHAAE